MSIHKYDEMYERRIFRIKNSDLSEKNKELILRIVNELMLDGLSKPRIMKYMEILKIVAKKLGKDFDKATKKDLMAIVGEIQQNSKFSPWTKQTYKVIIRRFYAWLHGMKGTKKYPKIVDWINIQFRKSETRHLTNGDLITQDEVEKMINSADHPRDKALIAVLWESGARIGEIGDLTFRQISSDKHGLIIHVNGKTGPRPVRLIWSVAYLSTWIDSHPFKDDKTAPVWLNIGSRNNKQKMLYGNFRQRLIRIAEKAGIKKRVHAHIFRHSRATFLSNHLTEFQMNQYLGWIQGSKMPSTYVHMSGRNLNKALLGMYGIEDKDTKKEDKLKPQNCTRCKTINPHDTKLCRQCGGVLNLRVAMEQDEDIKKERELRSDADKLMDMLLKDDDVKAMLMQKLGGIMN